MEHEILGVKLHQLDERVFRLHRRILASQSADPGRLDLEIDLLKAEYTQAESLLRETLLHSKSALARILAQSYQQTEQLIEDTTKQLQALGEHGPDPEAVTEEKLLLAEYALDFACQSADRALLLSLEAIRAQQPEHKEGDLQ